MNTEEFINFISARKSVREYEGDCVVTEEDKDYILACAKTAPSAGNLEGWDVIIVTDEGVLEQLSDAAGGQHQITDCGCVFVVCANYVRSMSRYGDRGILFAVQDATIACTYMMLACGALRLSTCWIGAFDEAYVKETLDLPTHIRPVAMLCVGDGIQPEFSPERMESEEHAHYDGW